ncbi:HTH myb-type domain-containing protein [Mycena kentingensis (nom. inval.)]|nr:HTH myb-type domain-containing protein [Mycena kentingensis (nom. inval.)]
MTSRVQKGGPIFKPVVKARARATSSVPRATPAPGPAPRDSVPPDDETPAVSQPLPPKPPAQYETPAVEPVSAPPPSRLAAPPLLVSKPSTPSPRAIPTPPLIATLAPPPTPTPNPSLTLVNPGTQPNSLPASEPEEVDELDADAVPPPKNTTRKRKKKAEDGETTATEGESAPPKRKKPKKARKKKKEEDEENVGETTATEGEGSAPKRGRKKKKMSAKKAGKQKAVDDDASEISRPQTRRKRQNVVISTDEEGEGDESEDLRPKKKKKSRKKPKPPPFDPDADPGEELDPTTVTMAELCEDNGQGRISSKALEIQKNHLAWKQQGKERRARMKAIAERKKYGRPEDDEEPDSNAPAPAAPETMTKTRRNLSTMTSLPPVPLNPRFNVQVRIGPNGETIIDEDSLTVDRTEEVDTSGYTHVVESDLTKFVNSASYTKKCRGSRWSAEETELFFDALSQHGENYELLSMVLPGRSRTACKNKFKAEDKKDPARINRCLDNRIPIDFATLGRLTGRDFSGPTPIISAPSPPPVPTESVEPMEPETPASRRKRSRSRSRPLSAADGVEIIGDAETYKDPDVVYES